MQIIDDFKRQVHARNNAARRILDLARSDAIGFKHITEVIDDESKLAVLKKTGNGPSAPKPSAWQQGVNGKEIVAKCRRDKLIGQIRLFGIDLIFFFKRLMRKLYLLALNGKIARLIDDPTIVATDLHFPLKIHRHGDLDDPIIIGGF